MPTDACVLKLPQAKKCKLGPRRDPSKTASETVQEYCIVPIRLANKSTFFKAYIVDGIWANCFIPEPLAERFKEDKALLEVRDSDMKDTFDRDWAL